jgi:hypothetical protein
MKMRILYYSITLLLFALACREKKQYTDETAQYYSIVRAAVKLQVDSGMVFLNETDRVMKMLKSEPGRRVDVNGLEVLLRQARSTLEKAILILPPQESLEDKAGFRTSVYNYFEVLSEAYENECKNWIDLLKYQETGDLYETSRLLLKEKLAAIQHLQKEVDKKHTRFANDTGIEEEKVEYFIMSPG